MKFKTVLKAVVVVVCLAAVFFMSYKISQTSERRKIKENITDSAAPEATHESEALLVNALPEKTDAAGNEDMPSGEVQDVLPTPTVINMPSDDTWSLVLLNKYYKMNDTYEPHLDECLEGTSIYLDKRVAEKFLEMYNAALENGVTLTPASGYVSADRQQRNFDKQKELFMEDGYTEEKASSLASYTVLPVGCSEHNYGLAIDIGWLSEDFAESPAYSWLTQHASEYGFIERYKSDKEDITHFKSAPWHWRYVGVEAAKEMNSKGLCLEEYVGKVN